MQNYPATVYPSPDYGNLLKDRVALVTGGAAGIGGSISRVFAKAGAKVVIVDIDPGLAQATADDIVKAGGLVHVIVGDVRTPELAKQAVEEAVAKFGQLDVLVNNAGHFGPYKLFADFTEEDFQTQYDISFLHVMRFTHAALKPMLAQQRGAIISVSSIEGQRGIPGNAVYSGYKAALTNFTKSLAVEVGPQGVRVNCLAPDLTHTPQTPMYDWLPGEERVKSWAPLGRFAHPDEQADVALFLASDMSRYVTGVTINADGGTTAASGWYRPDPNFDHWSNTPAFATVQNMIDV